MQEPRTTSEMMQMMANLRVTGILAERTVNRTPLGSDSEHNYCPYCRERWKRSDGFKWKESMKPMMHIKVKQLIKCSEKEAFINYEDKWECSECRRVMTVEDIAKFYMSNGSNTTEPRSKYVDLSKVNLQDPNYLASF